MINEFWSGWTSAILGVLLGEILHPLYKKWFLTQAMTRKRKEKSK